MFLPTFAVSALHFLHFIIRPLIALIHIRRKPPLPPITNGVLKMSATTLAKKIRDGELSCLTVVQSYVDRIREVNPFLNAVIEDRFQAALEEAKICDSKLKAGEVNASMLEKEKPLYGVPITVKESLALKGMSSTAGNVNRKEAKASETPVVIQTLMDAGAIPLCVTNTSEFSTSIHTTNFLHGRTGNSYDTRKSPGGSSGGEGALIGAAASVLGMGSDMIGSIRIPSHFNGIFGHKPTSGILSIQGHFPNCDDPEFQNMLVLGPMARYAEDLHLAMKVLTSKYERPLRLDEPVDVKSLRVFYVDNFDSFCGIHSTTSDIRQKIKEGTRYLAENGARVEHLSQEWVSKMHVCLMGCCGHIKVPDSILEAQNPGGKRRPILEMIKALFGLSRCTIHLALVVFTSYLHGFIPLSKLDGVTKTKENLRRKFNTLLGSDAVFIYPTFPQPTSYPEIIFLQTDSSVYVALANMLHLPSTHVPMGLNRDGLPIGLQVTAASHQDRLCLAVARELEKAFGGWTPPPS
ncbi:PREDICTED: fatty-acid amide hydrolase 2-B-like [Dufourea novaeangliae]|uniref:Fatty-acid amide hydrolase 2 n=1 Tax=Dufourea novaeangliae TaxID=178035 RepID=A0A154PGX8_DUFNO|nr:PREDICTED: fatty-acid amide hydrolase 2-B-like [Dufourea novaeangliae]XP_015432779.1 PREDICTED: fatty-acid amide hydrolase 2-B-like [Dufourea novaeangliae]KZC10724.1 Fatty-acid amide hydrolase 2 [Dufourea novaeangliae]